MRASCLTHLILLDLIYLRISAEEYKIWSSSLCTFLHSRVTSSPYGPNILLKTLFSNILSLCSSLNVRDQILHSYRTGRIMVLYILTFTFLDSRQKDKRLWTEWQQAFLKFSLLLISSCMLFWSAGVVLKYLNFATPSKDLFAIFMLCFLPSYTTWTHT
jgi:hypothetical protein